MIIDGLSPITLHASHFMLLSPLWLERGKTSSMRMVYECAVADVYELLPPAGRPYTPLQALHKHSTKLRYGDLGYRGRHRPFYQLQRAMGMYIFVNQRYWRDRWIR